MQPPIIDLVAFLASHDEPFYHYLTWYLAVVLKVDLGTIAETQIALDPQSVMWRNVEGSQLQRIPISGAPAWDCTFKMQNGDFREVRIFVEHGKYCAQ